MSTWQDRPDAPGLWWVRREDHQDTVVAVDASPEGVWINRGGEGWCDAAAEYAGAQWCRVVAPERVEALESALREVCDALGIDRPAARRALAVLRGTTVAAP